MESGTRTQERDHSRKADRIGVTDQRGRICNAIATGEHDLQYRTIGIEDGIERWIAARGGSVFQDGQAFRFIGTVIDIAAQKQSELALSASEQALKLESQELDRLARTLEQRIPASA